MASSGYQLWSVIAGEQPTTAKWNMLGNNDASFNSGVGLNDSVIVRRHLGMRQSSFAANYNVGSTDTTWTGTIPFNNVLHNIGNDYNATTGVYTAPVNGMYMIMFDCYTNNTTGRSQIQWVRSGTTIISSQHEQAGKTVVHMYNLIAGDQISVGGNASFPVHFYSALAHNLFAVTLLWETA